MASLTSTTNVQSETTAAADSGLLREIGQFWRQFFVQAFSGYRPELHYMRGPGPAWHAKHGPSQPHKD